MSDTIGRCRDCKYSGGKWQDEGLWCRLSEHDPYEGFQHPDGTNLFYAVGGYSESACLSVSPDFGCVAFVAKEPA